VYTTIEAKLNSTKPTIKLSSNSTLVNAAQYGQKKCSKCDWSPYLNGLLIFLFVFCVLVLVCVFTVSSGYEPAEKLAKAYQSVFKKARPSKSDRKLVPGKPESTVILSTEKTTASPNTPTSRPSPSTVE
jgi:hypothetical protein